MNFRKKILINTLLAILIVFTVSCGSGKPVIPVEPIPMEDFFRNSERNAYQISPDGKYFSYLAPYENRLNIFVQEVGKDSSVRITSETERDIAGYFWANNKRVLYLKDTGGDENYHLFGVDADGSNTVILAAFIGVRTDIIDELPDIPTEVIIGMNRRAPEVFDPYRLNIETGKLTLLAENPGNIQDWILDHDGKLRAAITIDGTDAGLLYRGHEGEPFRTVLTTNFREELTPQFFTFDNKYLYVISNIGRDKGVLVKLDPATGKEMEVLFEHPKYDLERATYSHKDKKLLTAIWTGHRQMERHYFDPHFKSIIEKLQSRLVGYEYGLTSETKDESRMIIRTYSDKSLGSYYLYDVATDQLTKLADVSPWLDENKLADMNCVTYTSRDGLPIEAYLTLPKGYTMETAKDLPVVINPHGGPWARDTWGFNPEVQFLANRGYAVFQMNFRGSTGFGRKFWELSFKQWGKTMQDDITDGVQWLVKQGVADPKRVAIYGASYGGYATLAGLTFTPDLYACGIDYVGVSNMFTFMNTIPPYWKPLLDMMYEMVGNPKADSTLLAEVSPVLHIDRIKAPLFIAQGANDPRVNKDESDQMVEALKKRGVDVQYMVKDNEGHGFANEENRFDFYRAMETFLKEHMGN